MIAEYKVTNKELQRRVEIVVSSPTDHNDTSPTLEADDSKTDTSLMEVTPVNTKSKCRAETGDGLTEPTGSFEDSNSENEPEVGRPRTASVVSRKGRVTRKVSKGDLSVEDEKDRLDKEPQGSFSTKIISGLCRASVQHQVAVRPVFLRKSKVSC